MSAPSQSSRLASLALTLAVGVLLGEAVRSVWLRSPATPALNQAFPSVALSPVAREAPDDGTLRLASDDNVFDPDRQRGGLFRPEKNEAAADATARQPALPEETALLVGTAVVAHGRSFVVCELGGDSFRLVRLGEQCGSLTLEAVEPGRGQFRDPNGERVTLEIPKPGTQ